YYLMQAKVEPGNIGGPQISPTLQATRSNYTRVHQGNAPKYLEYFTGERPVRVLVDQLQSEQGSRFLGKRNRNLIIETREEVPVEEGFRWMTLGEIKHLLRLDNIVNMDTRSVISCIPLPASQVLTLSPKLTEFGSSLLDSALSSAQSPHTTGEILSWLSRLRATYHRQVVSRGLDRMQDWFLADGELKRRDGRYFSVIGARVEIRGREVSRWSQPLLHHPGRGLNGMVTQKIGDVLHFLIRACSYPGSRELFELGPTVSRSDYAGQFDRPEAPPFLNLFRDPAPSTVRFCSVQSEECGRFFQYQNQYMILELPTDTITKIPEGFVWMTLGQIQELMPHGYFSIEARNLFACLHLI
ncbi:MAG TPA: NDP-hexose 2,3-dehydratase family protein, partial [Bryobacteraceae bacterium]|nr:NDP-hexose 2,3-dehydratase family protein [Bryobacteraceae bacterium]